MSVLIITEWSSAFYRAVRAAGITAAIVFMCFSCVTPCDDYLMSLSNITDFYLSPQYFDTECCWFHYLFFQLHTDINTQKINPAKHTQCPVCHLLYFTSWMIHQALFSPFISWWVRACLTAPLLRSWNRPSVGGQRVSSNRNPRTKQWSGCHWSLLCPGCAATAAAFWAGADRWPGERTAADCDVSQSGTKTQALGRS